MNDNDMANMIKKAQEMINNNQVPDELKNLVANMQNNSSSNSNDTHNYSNSNMHSNRSNSSQSMYNNSNNFSNMNSIQKSSGKQDYNKYSSTYSQRNNNMGNSRQNYNGYNQSNSENSGFPDIDIETMMKLQNIMSKMKSVNSDDDMSKLLISLKPYLRNEKQEKVDEYIKLIRMGKITQAFDLFGGDKN